MKKNLTIILAAAMMLLGTNAFAQLSVGAGYLNSSDNITYKGDKSSSNLNGGYVGLFYNMPLAGSVSLNPGVYGSFLMAKAQDTYVGIVKAKTDIQEIYVNVPVNVRYNFELASDTRLFAYAGPTLSYGVMSKAKTNVAIGSYSADSQVNRYDKDLHYSPFDVLLGGGVGFDIMDKLQVTVGYKYGLLNRYNGDAKDYSRHRSQLNLGVAFIF